MRRILLEIVAPHSMVFSVEAGITFLKTVGNRTSQTAVGPTGAFLRAETQTCPLTRPAVSPDRPLLRPHLAIATPPPPPANLRACHAKQTTSGAEMKLVHYFSAPSLLHLQTPLPPGPQGKKKQNKPVWLSYI